MGIDAVSTQERTAMESKLCERKCCDVMSGVVGEGKAKRWSNNGRFSDRTWKNGVASHRVPFYSPHYYKQPQLTSITKHHSTETVFISNKIESFLL